jgi:hypothetical protein
MVHPAPDEHGTASAACATALEEILCEGEPDFWIRVARRVALLPRDRR